VLFAFVFPFVLKHIQELLELENSKILVLYSKICANCSKITQNSEKSADVVSKYYLKKSSH